MKNGPPDLSRLMRTIGTPDKGNRPLPEATVQSAYQPRYDKAMNAIADVIPVLGNLRGLKAGHELAQAGSPLMGAATAALSIVPEAGGAVAKKLPRIARAAIELPDGTIHWAANHAGAIDAARRAGDLPHFRDPNFSKLLERSREGFVDEAGTFLSRDQATQRMRALGSKMDGAGLSSEELRFMSPKRRDKFLAPEYDLPFRGERTFAESFAKRAPDDKTNPDVLRVLQQFQEASGGRNLPRVKEVSAPHAKRMAEIYESLPKNDPAAREAYDALNSEVSQQFKAMKDAGYSVEFTDTDPYKNSKEMMADVRDNKRLKVFKTPDDSFHPYMTPEQNNQFRAVHDWLAHAGEGHSFGPIGEENAYRVHSSTLSPQAQRALATETRGQNSWVNFGPNGHLPIAERPFAEQKAALWPEEFTGDYDDMVIPQQSVARAARTPELQMVHDMAARQGAIDPMTVVPPRPTAPAAAAPMEAPNVITTPKTPDWLNSRGVFDRSAPNIQGQMPSDPRLVPPVPKTARASTSPLVDAIMNSKTIRRGLDRDVDQGMSMGGPEWYELGPIKADLDARAGTGAMSFSDFNMMGGGASQSNSVPAELSAMSIINYARKRGLSREEAVHHFLEATGWPKKAPLMGSHMDLGLLGIENGGAILPADPASDAWKIPMYADKRMGGGGSLDVGMPGGMPALDTHERRRIMQLVMDNPRLAKVARSTGAVAAADANKGALPLRNALDYQALSGLYTDGAKRRGLPTAGAYQAGRWTGGWKETGLKSPPSGDFTQILEDALLYSAQQRGMDQSPAGLRSMWGRIAQGDDFILPWSGKGYYPIR